MAKRLIIAAPGRAAYETVKLSQPGLGEIRVKALLSAISHGTEMAAFMGTSPFIRDTITPQRYFIPKPADAEPFYPFRWCGYDLVGTVTAVGPEVTGYAVGDRLFLPIPHQNECVVKVPNAEYQKLRPGTAPEDAIMASLATVAFVAVQDAEVKLGDVVCVVGGGAVGQLAVQVAFLQGAGRVFLVEPNAARRQLAASVSAVEPVDPGPALAVQTILERTGGTPPDVVIECSGKVKALQSAIQIAGLAGTVVAAGFYTESCQDLRLDYEFLHNRVTIKASMGVWGCPSRWPLTWNRARSLRTVMSLIEAGKFRFDGFVSLRVPFAEAQRAYETIRDNPQHLKVVLTY